jgi:hypothetical protein
MSGTIKKIANIKSFDEALTRSGQAISAYREQRQGGRTLPSDEEFARLIDREFFGSRPVISESLWQQFYRHGTKHFFPSLTERGEDYIELFGQANAARVIRRANDLIDGRIDLLGVKGIKIGRNVDWHREPRSLKRSPLKHWKEFEELDQAETGDKKFIWELNRHQHFFTLGVAFRLTGDERYGKLFAEHLDSWMEQNPPSMGVNWLSSLEVAMRAISWLWAFHLFRDSESFVPDTFKQALKYLYLHGRHIEKYLSKYYSPNTHLTGEGLGLYYLGTQLPLLTRAGAWKKLGEEILINEIGNQILPDGTYFEQSTWYQRYTADFLLHYLGLKLAADGQLPDRNLDAVTSGLEALLGQMAAMQMPDGTTPLIGDDDGGRMLPLTNAEPNDHRGTLCAGAALLSNGELAMMSDSLSEEAYWILGRSAAERFAAIEPVMPGRSSRAFPDGGYFVMRDGFSSTDNAMIIDCGDVGALAGGHGHADTLSITVAVQGRNLLVDPGTYTYHESPELRDYFRSSMAHNTLEVDGWSSSEPGGVFAWRTRADATPLNWISEDRFDLFDGSHNGYQSLASPVTHRRSVLFIRNDYWVIRDAAETPGAHDYALNFHYAPGTTPEISSDGEFIGDDGHRMYTFGDGGSWQQRESWVSSAHGSRVNAPLMRYLAEGEGTQEFFTFLLPVDPGEEPPTVREVESSAGRAFAISYRGFTDVFVYNDLATPVDTGMFVSDFEFSWARISAGKQDAD